MDEFTGVSLTWAWVRRVLDAWIGRIQSILIRGWNLIFLSTLGNLGTLGTLGTLFSTSMLRAWIWHVVDIRAELLQRTGQAQQMQMHLHLHLTRKKNIVIPRQRKLTSWFGRYLHVLNLTFPHFYSRWYVPLSHMYEFPRGMGILRILVFASCKVRYDISPYTQRRARHNPREKQGQQSKPVHLVKKQ